MSRRDSVGLGPQGRAGGRKGVHKGGAGVGGLRQRWRSFRAGRRSVDDAVDFRLLLAAAVLTQFIWQLPFGNLILYPLTLLMTWFHEMGHGLTAAALGGHFEQLKVFGDGSGLAYYHGPLVFGRFGDALVSAAGPLGLPIAGALIILCSTRRRTARYFLLALCTALVVSALLLVRTPVGIAACCGVATGLLWVRARTSEHVQAFVLQFLGVQACFHISGQIEYVFSSQATIGGHTQPSDSAAIAQAIGMTYWFWGVLITVISLALLGISLRIAYARHRRAQGRK